MARRFGSLWFTLTLALAATSAGGARADTVLDGTTDGGASFRIVVPTLWNGSLVIYNHGMINDLDTRILPR